MAGRYESWFLSARDADPGRPARALWIRHTRHRLDGAEAGSAALWCTVFDSSQGAPTAVKESVAELPADSLAGPAGFRGAARAGGRSAAWEIALAGGEPPLRHLRPAALYRLPLPRTKLEAPLPDGIASGRVEIVDRSVDLVGWRATVGHNWGAEHAERWVWLHAAGFEDASDVWLDLALARVRVARATTPWIGNGAVSVAGERFRLGGLGHIPGVRVAAAPGRLEAIVPGTGVEIRVAVHADLEDTVAFRYAGVTGAPAAGDREVLHAGLAEVRLRVRRPGRTSLELATEAGGAYELGGRDRTHGVPLQPFPDP